jgi:hypothetical protein
MKSGLYTHNGALREIETSQEKSETLFWLRNCKTFYHLNKHETANFGQVHTSRFCN